MYIYIYIYICIHNIKHTFFLLHAEIALASSAKHKRMTERVDTNSAGWYGYPMMMLMMMMILRGTH